MSTVRGLSRLFLARSTRVLFSRNVPNNSPVSCRSRSIFAATTRGASHLNPTLAISCACSKVCSCELHKYTQADSEIMDFLKKEIQHEKGAASKEPPSDLFQSKVEGTLVKLEREHNAERIVVSFDLNENTNQDESPIDDEDDVEDDDHVGVGKIVSYPYFTVEITKKVGIGKGDDLCKEKGLVTSPRGLLPYNYKDKTLKFYCEFNTQLDEDFSDHEEGADSAGPEMLNIVNVSVVDTPGKEKTVYSAETENMDGNLYVMLLNMLAERGIDNNFCQWLLDYSTALEQKQYIQFLEDLQGFVKLQ